MSRLNHVWTRHLEGIADELLHLAVACDLRLRDPDVIERIIRNDQTVCGRKNQIGFEKLRKLLMATFDSLSATKPWCENFSIYPFGG